MTPGVVRGNIWYLADEAPPGTVTSFAFGRSTDTPIVGDWDGDGDHEPGVVRGNIWYLADEAPPVVVTSFAFGRSTDTPIVGNWDAQGGDEIGVVRGNVWYLAEDVAPTLVNSFAFGRSTDTPIVGNWNGQGGDEIGVVRGNVWYLANDVPPTSSSASRSAEPTTRRSPETSTVTETTRSVSSGKTSGTSPTRHRRPPLSASRSADPTDIPIIGDWDGP